MTKILLICDKKKYLQNIQQSISLNYCLTPNSESLFIQNGVSATDRLLLINNCKFIYDWKSVHITHFKKIIRVHIRPKFFFCSLIIVLDSSLTQ